MKQPQEDYVLNFFYFDFTDFFAIAFNKYVKNINNYNTVKNFKIVYKLCG